jgi:hypothetical protein
MLPILLLAIALVGTGSASANYSALLNMTLDVALLYRIFPHFSRKVPELP